MAAMQRHFRLHRSLFGDFGVALLLASTSCVLARMAAAVPPNVNLSQDASSSRWARDAIGPDGSVAVVWEDDRYGNSEIVWRRFTMAGVPITPLVRVTNTPAASIRADIACDAEGRSHVVWQDGEGYSGTVHLCRLDVSGQVVLSDLVVSTVAGYPRVSALPTGESDVVWQQLLTPDYDVHYRRYDTVGAAVCDQRLTGGTASWVLRHPDVCTPTSGSAVVYWLDYLGQYHLYQGTITPDCQAASGVICNAAYDGAPGAAAGDEPVMVFPIYPAIYRYVSPGVYCPIPEGPGNKRSPDVAADNIQQYVAWQDTRNGNPDIYFSRFSACTNLSGDVRLTQDDTSSDAPAVAARDGEWAVVWMDNRDGNREIYLTSKQLQQPTGSCCAPAGTCTVTTQAACTGTWTVNGTCSPNICPQCPDGESYTDCHTISDAGILFAERYSTEADSVIPPGQRIVYDSTRVEITRNPDTRFYISGRPDSLFPWVCDDVLVITDSTGVDQDPQFGPSTIIDPSFPLCRPIETIITTLPAGDLTSYVPMGTHCVAFKLADTQREIFGNTAIYLLRFTVSDVPAVALDFQKIRVTPNPTGSATTVELCSRNGGLHTLTIHAPDGREIRTFPQVLLGSGQRQAWVWDRRDQAGRVVSPGMYFCSIQTPTGRLSARALVVR